MRKIHYTAARRMTPREPGTAEPPLLTKSGVEQRRKKPPRWGRIHLSVVIPCYNEAANLKRGALQEVADYLGQQTYSWEVVVTDDGSTDESRELVAAFVKKNPGFVHLKNKHGGKAAALWVGIKKAKGEIVLTTDMDQSTPIAEVEKLLPWFEKGLAVVIGSRGLVRKGFPWYRKLISRGFWLIRGSFLLREIKDTQCGFKAYRGEAIKKIFPELQVVKAAKEAKGWRVSAFDVEILFIAKKWGWKIKEVVVDWQDRDVATGKAKNFLKESKNMASEVWRVKLNDWQGKYDEQS